MDKESRYSKLGFRPQREIVYNKLLPYSDELDEESQMMLLEIKENLGLSVMMREMRPGCGIWTARLKKYIKLYGLKFSKEDHLRFVHLMYELVTIPNLEPHFVSRFGHLLITLLKKKELLSPDELVLPWRPLYELCERMFSSSRGAIGMYRYFSSSVQIDGVDDYEALMLTPLPCRTQVKMVNNGSLRLTLDSLVHAARFYFPVSSTEEMLNEWRPLLCPFDSTKIVCTLETMEWFLPISLPPSLSHMGYKLWYEDMMELWEVCNNTPSWENDMMWLMARLARWNIGYIDWEPYIPLMFTRFLRSLNLPVSYKQIQNSKSHKMDTSAMALWIVSVLGGGSSAQKHLDKFMMALESYFHPANFGRWLVKLSELLSILPLYFVQRLNHERYKKLTWETPVPESHKLSEDDVTKFVLSIKRVAMQAMYSRMGIEVNQAMQHLATLRPELIIPEIIESIHANLETLVQPHKFQAALQVLIAVIRPMIQGGQTTYKEGPTHVIPLLFSLLPGIDPNDIRKCFVSLHFIATVANMVPFVDCSRASEHHKDLTEEEEMICLATASFEDFVLQFLDRCFVLVESSSLESTRMEREADRRSRIENLAETALASTCIALLTQTSPEIFKTALKKLHSFVMGRILETKVAGQFLAAMCRSFATVNGEETLRLFIPVLCDNILTLTDSEEILKEETLDNELLYNFVLLSQIVDCPGKFLLPHLPVLQKVLDRTLHLTCREGYVTAARLLHLILASLTAYFPTEFRSVPQTYDDIKHYFPVRDWGLAGSVDDLQVEWYIPGKREVSYVKLIVESYLCPEMKAIEQFIEDTTLMTREELKRSLGIIWAILGCKALLPQWDEPPLELLQSCLQDCPFFSKAGLEFERKKDHGITVNNMNVRKALVDLMDRLQKKLLLCKADDTKSFFTLINIWECLLINVHEEKVALDTRWKRFRIVKKILENKLIGGKRHIRNLLIDRTLIQHELLENRHNLCVTPTHRLIMLNLFTLSTSQYSEVRRRAQSKLFLAMEVIPYSYIVLMDKLLENLKKDSVSEHEQFKGALYVLLGPKQSPVVTRHDWYVLSSLWPAIVHAKPSEKLSVIRLLDNVIDIVHKQFPTITINLEIPDSCEKAAYQIWASVGKESNEATTKTLVEEGKRRLEQNNKFNLEQYLSLLHSLNNAIENENLHWRFNTMALSFLRDLVHPDIAYPSAVVKCFLNTLVHDSLELRKIAIRSVIFLLKQQKRIQKKKKINPNLIDGSADKLNILCPGDRPDNQWVQYQSSHLPKDAEEWNKLYYAHRPYHGFYTWPMEIEVYEQVMEPPPLMLDVVNEKEKEVKDFFSESKNLEKLMNFLTLEEKKGKDKFNGYKFLMFKGLFRNGGIDMFKIFIPYLEKLVSSKLESHQRCAAEIIAGAIRGAKHWPFEMVNLLKDYTKPLVRNALANITEETIIDWGVCFATASESIDPRHNYWLFDVLMEESERSESSFNECGRLYALQGAVNQHLWRMSELLNLWLEKLRPCLSHPFQNVRKRIGSVLNSIFECDLRFPKGNPPRSPHIAEFVNFIEPQLMLLYNTCLKVVDTAGNSRIHVLQKNENGDVMEIDAVHEDHNNSGSAEEVEDSAIRLLKTVCKWISASVARSQYGIAPDFYQLFPLICLMDCCESDEELSCCCTYVLLALGQTIHVPRNVSAALTAIKKVSQSASWQARATCMEFLQVFVFNNMPVILNSQDWTREINSIVLNLIEDEWLDVRVKAAQVLGGLLHTGFIEETSSFLDLFKQKSATKIGKAKTRVDGALLKVRHGGVLGLCSFINAYPYDVPDFIPDLFEILGQHLNDPQPIPSTIRKTLGDFKRTHHDNWAQHSLKFTEVQLTILGDLAIPPSYYA